VPKKTGANLSVRAGFRCASEYCPGKASASTTRPVMLCGRRCSAAGDALRPVVLCGRCRGAQRSFRTR